MLNIAEYIIFITEWANKQLSIAHNAKLETIIRNQQVMCGGSESLFYTVCSQTLQVIVIHTDSIREFSRDHGINISPRLWCRPVFSTSGRS